MPRHVTRDDVIDLKLSTYDTCLTVNICVNFEVITQNFTTQFFKKSILKSFNLPLEGATAFFDVIYIYFLTAHSCQALTLFKATS